MESRIWISTTTYSKAYLAVAWERRKQLKDYEARGFAHFVYLTLSAHLEAVFAELLRQRYFSVRGMVRWESLPPIQFTQGEQKHLCDLKPVYQSIIRVVEALDEETHTATLTKLIERYNVLFSPSVREIVGKELHEDLLALASLRNLFAHGRDFFLEFETPLSTARMSLDSNPIQSAASRLHAAGILKDLKITGQTHDDFQSSFFADEALFYFYRAVDQIEQRLLDNVTFLPEKSMRTVSKLPKLQA